MAGFFYLPFWDRGFRPFFFAGALYAVLTLFLWVFSYNGYLSPNVYFGDLVSWHAHEMIYGFTLAIISGFLLTAVANWTGWSPVRKTHLGFLFLIWMAGRVVMNLKGVPFWLVISIEGIYIPALAISLSVPLLKTKNVRNFVFLGMLTALFACDIGFLLTPESRTPLYIALGLVAMMISLIGGRVIPAFAVGTLRRKGILVFQKDQFYLDIAAVASLVLVLVCIATVGVEGYLTAGLALLSSLLHLIRIKNYHPILSLKDPMLWILQIGYGWLVLGIALIGGAALEILSFSMALHALTAGAVGSMTLGMMSRVTMGHTGRDIVAGRMTVVSFLLMQLAAFTRVFGPAIFPEQYGVFILVSGVMWAGCFSIYLFVYGPMLFRKG